MLPEADGLTSIRDPQGVLDAFALRRVGADGDHRAAGTERLRASPRPPPVRVGESHRDRRERDRAGSPSLPAAETDPAAALRARLRSFAATPATPRTTTS